MGLGASILILSRIFGAAFGGRLFPCMAIKDEPADAGDCGEFCLRSGVGELRVRDARQRVGVEVLGSSHQLAEACSMNSRKLGRCIRTLLPTLAALSSPLLT